MSKENISADKTYCIHLSADEKLFGKKINPRWSGCE
jgi:hypothetical protein